MKKRILCLAMAVVMIAGMKTSVFAKDYQGKDGWLVDFDGKKVNSNFASGALADDIANVLPGDSIDLKVQVKNSSDKETDWYMTNEVLKALEDGSEASGGAYAYKLSYTDGSEETVLYDSENVGGESSTGGEGLHQVPDSLGEYFYLTRLASGKSGEVHLLLKIDGETQGNNYQETLAKLQMNFAVEPVQTATITKTNKVYKTNAVKTGDSSKALLFSVIALGSGLVLLILAIRSLKNGNKKRNSDTRKGA